MELILMRHGLTAGNLLKRYIGVTDESLAPEGTAQARSIVNESVEQVYVSSFRRAMETATICFPNATMIINDNLREMDFGEFEGRSAAEMESDPAYRAWTEANCEPTPPGADESWAQYAARVRSAVEVIIKTELNRGSERVYIVTHGGALMAVMSGWATPERPYYMWNMPHCSGYAIEVLPDWDGVTFFDAWRELRS